MKTRWTIVSHQNMGTANWRVTVKNLATNEEKSGVYPFNLTGNVYELECQPGTWLMASCGGYKIESSWAGQRPFETYRLKGTGETLYTFSIRSKGTRYYNLGKGAQIKTSHMGCCTLDIIIREASPDSVSTQTGQYFSDIYMDLPIAAPYSLPGVGWTNWSYAVTRANYDLCIQTIYDQSYDLWLDSLKSMFIDAKGDIWGEDICSWRFYKFNPYNPIGLQYSVVWFEINLNCNRKCSAGLQLTYVMPYLNSLLTSYEACEEFIK